MSAFGGKADKTIGTCLLSWSLWLPIRALTHSIEKVIHHVDVSWNQAFTKTDLIRFYKLANGILTITATPAIDHFSGKEVFHRIEFRKA